MAEAETNSSDGRGEERWPDSESGRRAPRHLWLSLGTIMLGMIPLAVLFAAVRIHKALGVAALALFLCAGSRTYVLVERKRRDKSASHADVIKAFLGSTGRLLGAILSLLVGLPAIFGVGLLVFALIGQLDDHTGAVRAWILLLAALTCILWLVLMFSMLRVFQMMFTYERGAAPQAKEPPLPSTDERSFKPLVVEVVEDSSGERTPTGADANGGGRQRNDRWSQ